MTPRTGEAHEGLTARIGAALDAAGAVAWGVTGPETFEGVRTTIKNRKRDGSSAGLTFTYLDPETATDVSRSLPWARSLVVAAWSYLPDAGRPGPARPGTGRVARFATEDHYRHLRTALDAAGAVLAAAGHCTEVLIDDNRLVDRAAAQRAGVGWWGKNTMVLNPKHGPWLLLGSLVTDAQLQRSSPMRRDCGTCDACRPACPTGALVAPGVLDARLCLARWLQARGEFPRELRRAVGDRIYGCDDCLDACPPGATAAAQAVEIRGRIDLTALLAASDEELLRRYGHFYLPKRRPDVLRRNALIALGNTGGPSAMPVLADYATHPSPLLRAHAVWALGVCGGTAAYDIIAAVAAEECDEMVRREIELTLADLSEAVV